MKNSMKNLRTDGLSKRWSPVLSSNSLTQRIRPHVIACYSFNSLENIVFWCNFSSDYIVSRALIGQGLRYITL